jgi:hypothetical protein
MAKISLSPGKIILLLFGLIILALLVLFGYKDSQVSRMSLATPAPPSPNAFDEYNTAYSLIKDHDDMDFATANPPVSGHKYTKQQKRRLVSENQPMFDAIDKALTQQYQQPPVNSWSTLMPYLAHDRAMARALNLQAMMLADDGDWDGCAKSSLTAMQMGAQLPHGGAIISDLVGTACQSVGRLGAWNSVSHVSLGAAKKDALLLNSLEQKTVPIPDVFKEEKRSIVASLIDLRNRPVSSVSAGQDTDAIMTKFVGNSVTISDICSYMDSYIAISKHSYRASLRTQPPAIPWYDPVMSIIAPNFSGMQMKTTTTCALNRMLEIQFALRAYYLEHGKYPASLTELAPSYLPSIPADPFAETGTFQYKVKPGGYLLYSIGPDGVDDGGKPIYDPQNPQESRYSVHDKDQKGDIVAGINH